MQSIRYECTVYTYHTHARSLILSEAVPLTGRAGAEEASSCRAGGRAAVTGAVPECELVSAISYMVKSRVQ